MGMKIDAHDTTGTPLMLSAHYLYLAAKVEPGIGSHEPIITVESRPLHALAGMWLRSGRGIGRGNKSAMAAFRVLGHPKFDF